MEATSPYDLIREFMIRRRHQLGFNQYELADAAGVSKGTVSMLEAGKSANIPKDSTLEKLARGLRVDPEILLELAQGKSDLLVMSDGGILRLIPAGVPAHLKALGRPIFDAAPQNPAPGSANELPRVFDVDPSTAIVDDYVELPYLGEVGAGNFILLEDYPSENIRLLREYASGGDGVVGVKGDSMTEAGIYPGMNLVVKRQDYARPGQVVLASIPYLGTVVKRLEMRKDGPYLVSQSYTFHPPIKIVEEIRIGGVVKHAWMHVFFS